MKAYFDHCMLWLNECYDLIIMKESVMQAPSEKKNSTSLSNRSKKAKYW